MLYKNRKKKKNEKISVPVLLITFTCTYNTFVCVYVPLENLRREKVGSLLNVGRLTIFCRVFYGKLSETGRSSASSSSSFSTLNS